MALVKLMVVALLVVAALAVIDVALAVVGEWCSRWWRRR